MRLPGPDRLLINGRFLYARPTGVQRVATALLQQLGERQDELRVSLPRGVAVAAPSGDVPATVAGVPVEQSGRRGGQIWEQMVLPRVGRGDIILSLANVGPMATRRGITMIHDAQVYTSPGSYSRAFVAWYRFLLPRLGRRNLQILTVSEFSKRELVGFGIAPADRITVIPNGCDHILAVTPEADAPARWGLRSRGYVVALSTTQPHKNIAILLRAFRDGAMGDLRLVLVGKAGAEEMRAACPDLPDDVIFTGPVSDGALRGLLEQALCFAMPSTTEGFGLPPLEAMLLGTPAVVAPCGALPEVCGDAALYAAPDRAEEWQARIGALRDDPTLFARLRAEGREQAGRFTWARAGGMLIDTIRRCAQPANRLESKGSE